MEVIIAFVRFCFTLFTVLVTLILFEADLRKWWAERNLRAQGYDALDEGGEGEGEGKQAEIDKLKEQLARMTGKDAFVDIEEIRKPEIDAQLVAENVAMQLERRIMFRRAMKKAVQMAMDFGAEGIRIRCAGRLGGAELSRTEQYLEGRVPLHTLRAKIDYGFTEAKTKAGILGIKCWICTGENKPSQTGAEDNEAEPR